MAYAIHTFKANEEYHIHLNCLSCMQLCATLNSPEVSQLYWGEGAACLLSCSLTTIGKVSFILKVCFVNDLYALFLKALFNIYRLFT